MRFQIRQSFWQILLWATLALIPLRAFGHGGGPPHYDPPAQMAPVPADNGYTTSLGNPTTGGATSLKPINLGGGSSLGPGQPAQPPPPPSAPPKQSAAPKSGDKLIVDFSMDASTGAPRGITSTSAPLAVPSAVSSSQPFEGRTPRNKMMQRMLLQIEAEVFAADR